MLSTAKSSFTVRLGLEQHLIVGGIGNGAPRNGERRQARSPPRAEDTIYCIMVDERAAPAAEAFGEHPHQRIEGLALERAIGPGPTEQVEQVILFPFSSADLRNNLLSQHVERLLGNDNPVELAAVDAVDERGALDEIVTREREKAPFGRASDRVAGSVRRAGENSR